MTDQLRRILPSGAELAMAGRLMRQRGWWGTLLAIAVLSVVFVELGTWQHHRYESKAQRKSIIDANYDAAPRPLTDVLAGPQVPLTNANQWRAVTLTGTYRPEQVLVRNRALESNAGFEVLARLDVDATQAGGQASTTFVVDRGWVPTATNGGLPEQLPAPPSGQVQVTVRLQPSETAVDRESPAGQIQRIDLAALYRSWQVAPQSGWQAYGVLSAEQPAPVSAPRVLPRPDEDLGPHLGYAWQWWMFAAAAFSLFFYYLLREARTVLDQAPTGAGRRPSTESAPSDRYSGRRPSGAGAGAKRARTSDEEWEDALVDSGAQVRLAHRRRSAGALESGK